VLPLWAWYQATAPAAVPSPADIGATIAAEAEASGTADSAVTDRVTANAALATVCRKRFTSCPLSW
jgi:hypothetical protein